MAITFGQICDAIKTTLESSTGIVKAQTYSELTEGFDDLPLMQVYPNGGLVDATSENNDRNTFRGVGRVTDVTINVDVICRQRSQLDEDMTAQVEMADNITAKLEEQRTKPLFGNALIRGFRWRWERVNFQRGDQAMVYPGVRFVLTIKVF